LSRIPAESNVSVAAAIAVLPELHPTPSSFLSEVFSAQIKPKVSTAAPYSPSPNLSPPESAAAAAGLPRAAPCRGSLAPP